MLGPVALVLVARRAQQRRFGSPLASHEAYAGAMYRLDNDPDSPLYRFPDDKFEGAAILVGLAGAGVGMYMFIVWPFGPVWAFVPIFVALPAYVFVATVVCYLRRRWILSWRRARDSARSGEMDGTPHGVPRPGKILKAELDARGIRPESAARELGLPQKRLVRIIHGSRRLGPDTALRLGEYFGDPPHHWSDLQSRYDLAVRGLLLGAVIESIPRALDVRLSAPPPVSAHTGS